MQENLAEWHLIDRQVFAAQAFGVRTVLRRVTLPVASFRWTFRVVCQAFAAGPVTISLSFGFQDVDADASPTGINFAALGAAGASDCRSVAFDSGAVAAPDLHGNQFSIIPPRMSIGYLAVVAATGTYELHGTGCNLQ